MPALRSSNAFFSNPYTWLVLLLLGSALTLRISHLAGQTIWLDETVHLLQARNFLRQGDFSAAHDWNGVLFTILLVPVFKIFGTQVEHARLLSVLFGLGSLLLMYRLATRWFSASVGVIVLALASFSPYLIFWSKMARNYSIFLFFCLLATWQIFVLIDSERNGKNSRRVVQLVYLLATLIAGFFSHYLMLLYVAGTGIWLLLFYKNQLSNLIKFNLKLITAAGLAMIMLLAAALLFLTNNDELLAWASPDWQHLKMLYSTAPWYSVSVYSHILWYDWPYLSIFMGIGLFFLYTQKQFTVLSYFICCFIGPFLLLSFVFREPTAGRYLIFIYPVYLIVAAYGLQQFAELLLIKAGKFMPGIKPGRSLEVAALLLLPLFPYKNLQAVYTFSYSEQNKPDDRLIECVFSDWLYTSNYLKSHLQPRDVVLATLPQIANVYLDKNNVGAFRQLHLDNRLKKYVPNSPDAPEKNSAQTTGDLQRTVEKNGRGWLLADFYLEGVMTDPAARNFVFQRLHFYPEASRDGSVLLFGWDQSQPAPQNQNMIVQVGRADKPFSRNLTFQAPDAVLQKPALQMRYRTAFVENTGEATVEINGYPLPLAISGPEAEVQTLSIPVRVLRRGQNVFRFVYTENQVTEQFKGYVVYYLEFVP